jgi:hypothetical protein
MIKKWPFRGHRGICSKSYAKPRDQKPRAKRPQRWAGSSSRRSGETAKSIGVTTAA